MSVEVGLWRRGPLTDVAAAVVALGVVAGALLPTAVPVVVGLALVVLAAGWRRALGLALAAALLASALSHQAWAGLAPVSPGPFQGTVTLVADPSASFGGWQVDVRTAVGRVELVAGGGAGGRLSSRQAGERIEVTGRLEALAQPGWGVPRHVRGRLVADDVDPVDDGGPVVRMVNGVRALVVRGARSLPADQKALFTGFVLGDDRGASVGVADDFEGAGLTHLLVVSGQNVAFVLAVAAPALTRLRLRGRLVATIGVILLFAAVTRFEPSVLRAATMASVGAVAVALGRPASGIRVVALAVGLLVLVDPLLVHSMGFRLSTAAAAGIIVLARPLGRALPGPSWLTLPLAVTLSAQAAVAPLLVPAFGPMPVAAIPANLLAEPVAGLVMMWGCTGGLLAGLAPAPVAAVLHLPTRAGLWWVGLVARVGADLPLGALGLAAVAALAVALAVGVALRRRRPRVSLAAFLLTVVLLGAAVLGAADGTRPGRVDLGGAELWRGSGPGAATVLVVPGNARGDDVLAGLRRRGVRRIDLVVLRSPGPSAAGILEVVRSRLTVDQVWAPRGSPARGAREAPASAVEAGGVRVACTRDGERLDVVVETVAAVQRSPDVASRPGGAVGASG